MTVNTRLNNQLSLPIYLLYRRFMHHSSHSGYDQLSQYVGDPIPALPGLFQHSFIQSFMDGYVKRRGYDPAVFYPELSLALILPWRPPAIFHHLYGDHLYCYFAQFPGARRHKILATFHTMPASKPGLFNPLKLARISQLDAAVVVGRNQIDFFADLLGTERVFFVPCGVHTAAFVPPAENRNQYPHPTVLTVGQTERDFQTYYEVIRIVRERLPRVRFILIANPEGIESSLAELGMLENFEFRAGIDEASLIEAYQRSHLLYLPLLDSTANLAGDQTFDHL